MTTDRQHRTAHLAQPDDVAERQRRAAVRARQLAELMDRRPELFGVHPPADLVADSVRWSA